LQYCLQSRALLLHILELNTESAEETHAEIKLSGGTAFAHPAMFADQKAVIVYLNKLVNKYAGKCCRHCPYWQSRYNQRSRF
jgi:hypothetical protein